MFNKVVQSLTNPDVMVRVHKWATLAWIVATPFIILFLSHSVPFLVGISVYAVITGHWGSYQSVRVEVNQKSDANVQDVIDELKK